MLGHPLLDRLDAALAETVPSATVGVHGDWTSRTRRSYETAAQLGSGLGPYIDVVDYVWVGRLSGATLITGMALLHTESGVHWAKAAHASEELRVQVSLRGYADWDPDRMNFAAGLDDAFPLSGPIEARFKHPSDCLVAAEVIPVGRVVCIARAGGTSFFVVLFARDSVKFGRNRLWRLRDSIADHLPSDLAELLTRRRAGFLPPSRTL